MAHEHAHGDTPPRRSATFKWLAIGLLVVAAILFIAQHWVHVPRFLPYLLIALCPLMHLFHGHGGHGHKDSDGK
ncbi:MAG TPA: DUF2933 domain-containing protein [Burkholderiales bacterium]|nr:DUF2933 domain-containing protein [Burkholderiales bacterium]